MPDPRHQKLAQVLVRYSLDIQPGDRLVIMAGESAAPAIREVYREAVRAGAHVTVRTNIEGLTEIFFQEANDDQLQYVSEVSVFEMEHFNKYLGFQAEQNSKALSAIDPKRLATSGKARQPLQSRMMTRAAASDLHWCATLYPTNGYAQDAGMSLSDYEEFVYCAELIDQADPIAGWKAVHDTQQHIVDYLTKHDEIHIVTPDNTDITYRVGGRTWMNADGLNHSGLHWDMLCDLHSGKVYADGELCYQDGKFII